MHVGSSSTYGMLVIPFIHILASCLCSVRVVYIWAFISQRNEAAFIQYAYSQLKGLLACLLACWKEFQIPKSTKSRSIFLSVLGLTYTCGTDVQTHMF